MPNYAINERWSATRYSCSEEDTCVFIDRYRTQAIGISRYICCRHLRTRVTPKQSTLTHLQTQILRIRCAKEISNFTVGAAAAKKNHTRLSENRRLGMRVCCVLRTAFQQIPRKTKSRIESRLVAQYVQLGGTLDRTESSCAHLARWYTICVGLVFGDWFGVALRVFRAAGWIWICESETWE